MKSSTTGDPSLGKQHLNWKMESSLPGEKIEKMSKSKYNVVNPDDICDQYGADTLRMYELFLGPIEQAKTVEHRWDFWGVWISEQILETFSR